MDYPDLIVCSLMETSIDLKMVNIKIEVQTCRIASQSEIQRRCLSPNNLTLKGIYAVINSNPI